MARIVFAAAAYLGDVAPYVAPANRLAQKGHDVTFLTPVGFHGVLSGERFALAIYPFDFSARAMHADPVHERLMRHPIRNQVRLARYWMRAAGTCDPVRVRDALLETIDGADVVVSHPTFGSVVVPAAQHLGVPAVVGQLFPMMIPTARWTPPLAASSRNFGATVNRLSWRGLAIGSGMLMLDRDVNAYRRSLGLTPLKGNALLGWSAAARTVVLVSRHYFGAEAPDWNGCTWGGFSAWDGPANRAAVDGLDEFATAGDAPVLVCLGTSAASGAGRAFAQIADDLDRLGLRSLLLVGNAANLRPVDDRVGAFEFAPVTKVLPHCRAAVVSGALGTLAAALSAARPVVVLPQLFDQLWHGRRVEELGVGIMVRRPSQVGAAVAQIERDASYRARAGQLAARMADEDGAGALVAAVESLL